MGAESLEYISYSLIGELETLFVFCRTYRKIYLYGAGKIGRRYLDFLISKGIIPAGFIITEGDSGELNGIKISPVLDIKDSISNDIGIIATFKGAEESYIRSKVGTNPGVFVPTVHLHSIFYLELELFPFIKRISTVEPVVPPIHAWKNILIIRLDVLGDSIMSTAFIREVKKTCPESRITLIVRPSNESLFKDCPYISKLVLYECNDSAEQDELSFEQLTMLWQNVKKINAEKLEGKYDVAFQLCSLLSGRGALEALLLGYASKSKCQIGRLYAWKKNKYEKDYLYAKFSNFMSYISYDMMPKHEVACMLDMLRRCGGSIHSEKLELWCNINEKTRNLLLDKFNIDSKKVWIAVGIVGRTPAQCWPPTRFEQLFEELGGKYDIGFIMFGGYEARETAQEIKNGAQILKDRLIDLTGKTTLQQAIEVMKHCVAYVGANTGLMHMAAALGKPVVEISFYVRDENGQENSPMGPWGTRSIILQKVGLDGCREICSKPYSHCITQISVQEVVKATEHLQIFGDGKS